MHHGNLASRSARSYFLSHHIRWGMTYTSPTLYCKCWVIFLVCWRGWRPPLQSLYWILFSFAWRQYMRDGTNWKDYLMIILSLYLKPLWFQCLRQEAYNSVLCPSEKLIDVKYEIYLNHIHKLAVWIQSQYCTIKTGHFHNKQSIFLYHTLEKICY